MEAGALPQWGRDLQRHRDRHGAVLSRWISNDVHGVRRTNDRNEWGTATVPARARRLQLLVWAIQCEELLHVSCGTVGHFLLPGVGRPMGKSGQHGKRVGGAGRATIPPVDQDQGLCATERQTRAGLRHRYTADVHDGKEHEHRSSRSVYVVRRTHCIERAYLSAGIKHG